MLVDTCAGCHGTNGNSVGPASPSIAAMDPLVFVDTMIAFQEGDTYSTIMGRIAKGYSEEEFEEMGEYLNEQAFVPAKQEFDQALVETAPSCTTSTARSATSKAASRYRKRRTTTSSPGSGRLT
jgi:sulfide dehydrogenase cytochrome subunit